MFSVVVQYLSPIGSLISRMVHFLVDQISVYLDMYLYTFYQIFKSIVVHQAEPSARLLLSSKLNSYFVFVIRNSIVM